MAQVARQNIGLSAPQSRQDIVSALLNQYGNSFASDGTSPSGSAFSPVPSEKELPPPPPGSESMRNKPLPAVQRAEQRMSTKFQLRTIADGPFSPKGIPIDPSSPPPRQRIRYRSLSREAKPPSLNLITSNGSTAIVPPTPALPTRAQTFSETTNFAEKDLPSPPPPPPEKSARRSEVQRKPMGLKQSKSQQELARSDSLLSQEAKNERPATVEAVTSVKRKELPAPAAKKFLGLGQLGTGPRGGKGGPLPPVPMPRKKSVDEQPSRTEQGENIQLKEEANRAQSDYASANDLPPTPEEAPAPPRKAYVPLGLPSNPRARAGPVSPLHTRGKSSTGFNLFKAQRPAPAIPTKVVETLTPEMTPSPTLKPEEPKNQLISPVTPLPPPNDQRRPFSFEPSAAPAPPPKTEEQPKTAVPIVAPQVTAPPALIEEPQRPTSADLSGPSSPELSPPTLPAATSQPPEISQPAVNAAPAPAVIERQPSPVVEENASTPPPFVPLTRAPIAWPQQLIPSITPAHLNCYAGHQSSVWSNNSFQPMGCMVCRVNNKERKWCCTWCQLRICRNCSEELCMVPGRNLGAYLEQRQRTMVNSGDVLSDVDEAEEREDDFS